jgi:formylmethanofuran dehydrogenase subunit E
VSDRSYDADRARKIILSPQQRYSRTAKGRATKSRYARSARGQQKDREYQAREPEKIYARRQLRNAVRRGEMHRPEVCGHCSNGGTIEASHTDYARPLDVEWLCRPCHLEKDSHE